MTATTTARPPARAAVLDRAPAMRLAAEEYRRFTDLLRELDAEDWSRPTDCPAWDVRAMAGHVLGMAQMVASVRGLAGQNVASARAGGGIDALTAVQVRRTSGLSAEQVVAQLDSIGPRAVRGRRRFATVLGRAVLPETQEVGGQRERWRFGFLVDVVLTRDTWMHRTDVARATGRDLHLTPGHDGVVVADVVAEWAARHGRPYRLRLTGPAGGSWSAGTDGDELELDAVEFCRVLSGRGRGEGLLAQQVPF
ncbi:maleylpyruvate isomerase family mycothiol-dependent enzyme [Blastococcus litoris]|uniref:maleylpyruvate isomerase family mycothiol-dependent enzyme n=1 Tax=Blastococcus litoris TaxID=2171622 RepID=UPI0019D15749|nr:maleylpyruvate isomerase family mycothiol-dependent enzyme [Blastococcus litoris]